MQICTNCEQDLGAFFESKFFSFPEKPQRFSHMLLSQTISTRTNWTQQKRTRENCFCSFFNHCENGFCICSIYLLTVKMNIAQKLQKININAKSDLADNKSVLVGGPSFCAQRAEIALNGKSFCLKAYSCSPPTP